MNDLINIRVLQHDTEDQIRIGGSYPVDDLFKAEQEIIQAYAKDTAWCGGFKVACEKYYKRIAIVRADTLKVIRSIYDRNENREFTPIMWDSYTHKFAPVECLPDAEYPILTEEKCTEICNEMNKAVLSGWDPQTNETYWHPCTWVPQKGFIPMDCSVTFDKASYPAFRTEKECQMVCDKLNNILNSQQNGNNTEI